MRNDREYAHRWLQDLIGWIAGLLNLMSKVFGGGCYITSAVVNHKGLDDKSNEMELLRLFRDTYILENNNPEVVTDFFEYQKTAPTIINWINSRVDSELIWNYVWIYVCEVISLINCQKYEEAYSLFKMRTLSLRKDILLSKHIDRQT
jgi:hypothetical protein